MIRQPASSLLGGGGIPFLILQTEVTTDDPANIVFNGYTFDKDPSFYICIPETTLKQGTSFVSLNKNVGIMPIAIGGPAPVGDAYMVWNKYNAKNEVLKAGLRAEGIYTSYQTPQYVIDTQKKTITINKTSASGLYLTFCKGIWYGIFYPQ